MRQLLVLALPSLLTSCVALPFFLDPNKGGGPDLPFDTDTGDPFNPDDTGDPIYQGVFDPYAVFISVQGAYDGEDLTGYYLFPNDSTSWQEPFITLMFVEEEYFNNYNGIYACTWEGYLSDIEHTTLGVSEEWASFSVGMELFETDCQNFDDREWGSTDPTLRLESMRLGIGYAGMSTDMRSQFRQAVLSWGEDWSDYEPYIFSTYFGFSDGFGGWESLEADFSFAFELAPEGGMVYGDDGDNVKLPVQGEPEPPQGLYASQAWRGFYAWVISQP